MYGASSRAHSSHVDTDTGPAVSSAGGICEVMVAANAASQIHHTPTSQERREERS